MKYDSLYTVQQVASAFITGGMSSSFRANKYNGLPMYVNEVSRRSLFLLTRRAEYHGLAREVSIS